MARSVGSSCTWPSFRSITRVLVSAASMIFPTEFILSLTLASTPPNFPNSVFTARSSSQTSLLRCCIASVRKPICKLLRKADTVDGPTATTLNSCRNDSNSPGRASISAYNPSVGTNSSAKSVVFGGFKYFVLMSFAALRTAFSNCLPAFSIACGAM